MNESQTEEIMEKCVNTIKELMERVSKLEDEMEKFKEILSEKNLGTLKIDCSSEFNNFASKNKSFEEKKIKDMENEKEKLEQKLYIENKNEEQNILNKENMILDKVENISEYSKQEESIKIKNAEISELSDKLKEKEEELSDKIDKVKKLEEENKNIKETIKSNNEEIETLKGEKKDLNLRISGLDEIIRENNSKILEQKDTITKKNAEISDLSDKLGEKEKKLTDEIKKVEKLEEENKGLKISINDKNKEIETLKGEKKDLNLRISGLDEIIRKNNSKISEQEDTITKQKVELEKFSNFKKIEEIFSKYDSIPKEDRKKYDSLLKPELGKDVFLFLAISKFENLKEFLQQDFLKNENFYPVLIDLYDYIFEIKNKEFDEEVYERIESEAGTKYNPITQIVSENGKSDGEIEKTIITGYRRKRDKKVLYKSIVLLK